MGALENHLHANHSSSGGVLLANHEERGGVCRIRVGGQKNAFVYVCLRLSVARVPRANQHTS